MRLMVLSEGLISSEVKICFIGVAVIVNNVHVFAIITNVSVDYYISGYFLGNKTNFRKLTVLYI